MWCFILAAIILCLIAIILLNQPLVILTSSYRALLYLGRSLFCNQENLDNKTVLITGASTIGSIGHKIAEAYRRQNCNLILVSRSLPGLLEVKDRLERSSFVAMQSQKKIVVHSADLQQDQELNNIATQFALQTDILVNAAAYSGVVHAETLTIREINEQINSALGSAIKLSTLFANLWKYNRKKKHIVNISSLAGTFTSPYISLYAACKMGLHAWTRCVSSEWTPLDIHMCTVLVGGVTESDEPESLGIGQAYRAEAVSGIRTSRAITGATTAKQVGLDCVYATKYNLDSVVSNTVGSDIFFILTYCFPAIYDFIASKTDNNISKSFNVTSNTKLLRDNLSKEERDKYHILWRTRFNKKRLLSRKK